MHVRNSSIFFGSCAGQELFDAAVDNLIGVLEGARERVIAVEGCGEEAFARAVEGLREWRRLDDAALWYAADWAEGSRPA